MNEPLEATLRRLQEERDEADRRYNEALTGVDRALPRRPDVPAPPLPLDEHQLGNLNGSWNTMPGPPAFGSGVRGRLGRFVWGIVGPYLQRQLTFNSQLVDHLNRQAEAAKAAHARELEMRAALGAYVDALAGFHTHVMLYFQQITGYVDTRDRATGGDALVVNAALNGLADAHGKFRETLDTREQRYQARLGALDDLRTSVASTHQALTAIKRQVERAAPALPSGPGPSPAAVRVASPDAFASPLDAYKYVGFEHAFRGPEALIRERQESYVPFFRGVPGDVLDIGCGRGEFIELLAAHGIRARGIDTNTEMAEVCRARGLEVAQADAVGYLATQPDGSLGGVFAAQVVEHLEPGYLIRFLDLAGQKLSPGGRLVLETLNPACWTAFFESYIRDITHRWPLHPETLKYLVLASGFTSAAIEYRSPIPEAHRLQQIALPAGADLSLHGIVDTFNENVEKVNARMFTHMDYAVVADKAGSRA
jgi:SAM-dependent methyltransferase